MKSLVVYYSYSGNTRLIAETAAHALDADIEELQPVKPLHASGAGYVMWGLRQLIGQSKPPLKPLGHDIGAYDLIVIGTPVWSYTVAPPVRTFLESVDLTGKQTALFCCHGGDPKDTLRHMKTALIGSSVVGAADFFDPAKHDCDRNRQKARIWADSLLKHRK